MSLALHTPIRSVASATLQPTPMHIKHRLRQRACSASHLATGQGCNTLLRAWPALLPPCGRPSRLPAPCAAADASSTDDWMSVRTAVSAAGQGGPGRPYRNLAQQGFRARVIMFRRDATAGATHAASASDSSR